MFQNSVLEQNLQIAALIFLRYSMKYMEKQGYAVLKGKQPVIFWYSKSLKREGFIFEMRARLPSNIILSKYQLV